MKQITLNGEFTLKGKGLHTGRNIEATFCPAPDNHGYKIQRTDVEGQPVIDALAENVISTNRGTVIGKGDVTVSTIEHAMSALYALGVDNCLIKLDGPEMPILDGSAKPFYDSILAVGMVEQTQDKDFYYVKHKIEVVDPETGSKLMCLPADKCLSILAAELEVLRNGAYDGSGKYSHVFTYPGTRKYSDVRANAAAVADFHIVVDSGEGTNLDVSAYFSAWIYANKVVVHYLFLII